MILPKKPQILYAPMLATFGGGSARGFGFGVGGAAKPGEAYWDNSRQSTWAVPSGVELISVVLVGGGAGAGGSNSGGGGWPYLDQ